jgi:hypothetical protein
MDVTRDSIALRIQVCTFGHGVHTKFALRSYMLLLQSGFIELCLRLVSDCPRGLSDGYGCSSEYNLYFLRFS